MSKKSLIHFSWMGAYWSCSKEEWDRLNKCVLNREPVDMDNCRELKSRPKGLIHAFCDNPDNYACNGEY